MILDVVNAIILGSWNPKIFTPIWVKTNLFNYKDNIQVVGLILPEEQEFAYEYDGIEFFPKQSLIEFRINDLINEQNKEYLPSLVDAVLSTLPHTPIKGVGFNFRYKLESVDQISPFVHFINGKKGDIADLNLTQLKYTKEVEEYSMNIVADYSNNAIDFITFNFHYQKPISFTKNTLLEHFLEVNKIIKI